MSTAHFKKTLLIRFIAYLCIIIGLGSVIFQFGPLISTELSYRKDKIFGVKHRLPPQIVTSESDEDNNGGFSSIANVSETFITPVSTEYGIVIEKINANAKVIPDIDPGNEREYVKALSQGVAVAKGSTNPGENGNLFIFSHSADAPWNIVRFNAIFYLLRELGSGDKIIVFYKGRRFDYVVFDKSIVSPNDVSFLNNRYDKPVLTLQTCDPPGTLFRRLIVRARLAGS